jgi:stage II sporulation protein Q
MRRRKLKGFVLPTLYLLISLTIFTGVIILGSDYNYATKDYTYTTSILDNDIVPVMMEEEDNTIISPIEDDNAEVSVHYYKVGDTEENQRNSLIFYENTYMPNTGILYTNDDIFNAVSVYDGKVIEIKDDEFFSKCVILELNNNIRVYYYGLDEITVVAGESISTGDIIGVSRNNEIMNDKKSMLLEVYYNNKLINPEEFIGNKITDYE